MDWKRGDRAMVDRPTRPIGPVKVMAVADGYAMVRNPGCVPFVERLKALLPITEGASDG